MARFSCSRILAVVLTAVVLNCQLGHTLRPFHLRSDLHNVPSPANQGWTVPLQGGFVCQGDYNCTDTLSLPSPGQILRLLTLARGILIYSCDGVDPELPPHFVSQQTQLFDAAPLVKVLPSETALHALVPELYTYNYGSLDNSTLNCVGEIITEDEKEVVLLNEYGNFEVHLAEAINPPEDIEFNMQWAKSLSEEWAWEVYRVETFAGAAPTACAGQNETVTLGYAAEYWLYHS